MVAVALAAVALIGAPLATAAPGSAPDAPPTTAPDSTPDAVTRLLIERGLLPADAASMGSAPPTLVQQVRDRVRDGASDMVLTAMNFLGVPYRRGGSTEATGFDCSGFTRHIFEMSLGLVLPRRADQQANAAGLTQVGRDDLRPGDLVFFNTMRRTFSHVGIYVGDGKFIHSPATGGAVRVDDMRYAYWSQRYNGARRAGPAVDLLPKAEAQTGTNPR
ncbi:MAG: hydrolase [Burkholderiales bacterium PBB1]|nr:MAG: hydrolase [Burkholderiales bacterium PBB1]